MIDKDKLVKKLGDLEFYLEGLRQIFDLTREYVLEKNENKLNERYKEKYTDTEAVDRRDVK